MGRPTVVVIKLMVAGALLAVVAACDRSDAPAGERGPAERAGEQIDQALTRAGEELEKVAEKTGKNLQSLGKRLEQEAQEAQRAEENRESPHAQRQDGQSEPSNGQ